MALLKKTSDSWQPSEKPNLKIGEVIEMDNYETLVKTGMAVIVDKEGNELELPGLQFTCPICFQISEGVMALTEHLSNHLNKNKKAMEDKIMAQNVSEKIAKEVVEAKEPVLEAVEEVVKSAEEIKKEETRKKRLAALEKARAARKAKAK